MSNFKKVSLLLLRVGIGVLFFLAGYANLTDPNWSAAGYIAGAKTFANFYAWLLQPNVLPVVNFLNEWGLALVGAALILGAFVRFASFFGAVMMILYYLPIYPPARGLIDEHIIYASVFLVFMSFGAGELLSLSAWFQTRLHPMWHKWVD